MADTKELHLTGQRLAPEVRIGCVLLSRADELPLIEAFATHSDQEASLTLTGDAGPPWDDVTLVSIRTFALPRGRKEFRRLVEWFGKDRKKRARLPEGGPVTENTLALAETPAGWEHEAFARSGRDVIHIYRSEAQAVLIRLLGKSGPLLENPVLRGVAQHAVIVPGQWAREFPETQPAPGAAAPGFRPLPPEVVAEVREAAARARKRLGLKDDRKPKAVVKAIYGELDAVRDRKRMPKDEKRQTAIDLGALWGEALCAAAGWEWACVTEDGTESYVVASPTRSHVVDPLVLAHRILTARREDNTALLAFNMIVAGNVPEAAPGACLPLA